jgi:hypothetical protein
VIHWKGFPREKEKERQNVSLLSISQSVSDFCSAAAKYSPFFLVQSCLVGRQVADKVSPSQFALAQPSAAAAAAASQEWNSPMHAINHARGA